MTEVVLKPEEPLAEPLKEVSHKRLDWEKENSE